MERVKTGNPQLDYIVDGGLPRHSINIITGLPGTGKTILAQQMCFAVGTPERPALYLSTVSEPQEKLVRYLQGLAFANIDRIGTDVIYESLVDSISREPTRLAECISSLIQKHRPAMIVIDSFKAIGELVPDGVQWRQLVFDLAGVLAAYDLTGIWVGEYESGMLARQPEFAIADGIIDLQRRQSGSRDERHLRVVKMRGSNFKDGEHAFTVSNEGLTIFPRLVAPTAPRVAVPVSERLRTGISGLDDLVESGWLRGTSTLVSGPSGAGKTVLGLHFLRQGVSEGEPGLMVNFQESPQQLRRAIESFGWNAEELLGGGRLDVLYTSPVELQIDTIVREILRRIEAHGVRRIVIDALGELRRCAGDKRRFSEYVYVLTQEFARRHITAVLIMEGPNEGAHEDPGYGSEVSYMSDNTVVLSMKLDADLKRTIRVTKTRGSAHDGHLHELTIGREGMLVG